MSNPSPFSSQLTEKLNSLPPQGNITACDVTAIEDILRSSSSTSNSSSMQIRPELLQMQQMSLEHFTFEYQRRLELLASRYNRLTGTNMTIAMDPSAPFGYHLQNIPLTSSSDNREIPSIERTAAFTPGLQSQSVFHQMREHHQNTHHNVAVSPHQHLQYVTKGGETTGGKTNTFSSGSDNTADKENMEFAAQWFATPPELGGGKCKTLSLMNSLAVTPQNPQSAIESAAYTKGDIT